MIAEKMKSLEVLSSHPKVHLMAKHLLIPPRSEGKDVIRDKRDITVAGLRQFWSVAKYHVREGVIHDADLSYIDAVVDYPGFGQAMERVGWVKYDKRRNCLVLPEMKGEQLKMDAKKSQAALRQQRYRMRLKVRNWITEGRKAAAELANNSRFKNQKIVITHDMGYDEEGRLLKFGSITVDGKTMHIGYSSPQVISREKHYRPHWSFNKKLNRSTVTDSVTVGDSGVTHCITHPVKLDDSSVTGNVTVGDSGVSQGATNSAPPGVSVVTQCVTHHVTLVDSGVTQSVTDSVTVGDSRVTPSVTDIVTVGDSRVTPSVTGGVTLGDSGVTRSFTHPVTHGDSGVTDHIPGGLSRVIPSRVRTRLGFLRSKTLRSKHKTTHSAREKIFMAAMRFKTKTAKSQNPTWPARSGHPRQKPVSLPEQRNYLHPSDALLNVTQSFTLWRNGQCATCVTQKTRHAELTPLPEKAVSEPGKFRLFSEWSPSADFLANTQHIGLTLSHEATDYEVAEFISYWSEEGAQHTQKQWETKLARFIGKGRKREAKRASGRRDFTIPTSMDYAIPDGFHGG